MIFRIAYRNIWRSPKRSIIIMFSIALGIWGALLVIGLAKGLTGMRQENAISSHVSHIQFHHPDFVRFGLLKDIIPDYDQLVQKLNRDSRIKAMSTRIKVECFLQSARGSSVLVINGIIPEQEKKLTSISETLEHGNYLNTRSSKPPIVISKRLSERLDLHLGSNMILSFNGADRGTISAAFKVTDIYKTGNSLYDEMNAFVDQSDIAILSGVKIPHELAIVLHDDMEVESIKREYSALFPGMKVRTWRDLAPELGYADRMLELVMILFLSIIMTALAFGIVNTMLMAVLERRKELGMLLAIGMNKKKVFKMIVLETILLSLIGAPIGMLLAILTQWILGNTGIDLSFLAKGLESVGLQSTIYPRLDIRTLLILTILVVITGILSAIYPARKALKLNPCETLRTAV